MEEGIKFGLPVSTHIGFGLLALILLSVFAIGAYLKISKKKGSDVPEGLQNVSEAIVEILVNQIEPEVGEKWLPLILPFIGSFFFYILVANWIGLFPFGLSSTADLSTTLALALISIVGIQLISIRVNGVVGAIKEWFKPVWWMFILLIPLRILDNIARSLSLSLRLFGNIGGEHLVFEQVSHVVPYVLPIVLLLLSVLVGLIQAAVFSLLSLFYLIEEVGIHGEGHH
ncbi:MAG: F0F1 ATP synthase subunit A [Actinobacteria bacterium]|nr:F0F1 ATP synthase subunit A [Actinomycetota bacterium]